MMLLLTQQSFETKHKNGDIGLECDMFCPLQVTCNQFLDFALNRNIVDYHALFAIPSAIAVNPAHICGWSELYFRQVASHLLDHLQKSLKICARLSLKIYSLLLSLMLPTISQLAQICANSFQ